MRCSPPPNQLLAHWKPIHYIRWVDPDRSIKNKMDTEEKKQKRTKHKQTKYRQIKKKDTTSNKQSREGQTPKDNRLVIQFSNVLKNFE